MALFFEWDPFKAKANKEKHKITFEEAASVFGDENALTIEDVAHSVNETCINFHKQKGMHNLCKLHHR